MFKKILIPLDGSELAERALEPALALAEQAGGQVILLSVPVPLHFSRQLSRISVLHTCQALEKARRELVEYLNSVQKGSSHPGYSLTVLVQDGDPASIILDTAAAENVDLIAMCTHSRSGFSRWVLGSVITKVLRQAPCPVLVIRPSKPISRILIPLDGSELAEQALEPGIEIAKSLGAQVTLFIVQENPRIDIEKIARLDKVENGLGKIVAESIYKRGEAYLRRLSRHIEKDLGIHTQIAVADGPVARCIINSTRTRNFDLIVMATHGRTGLRRWVHGNVTEKVFRGVKCAMLVVHPPKDKLISRGHYVQNNFGAPGWIETS
jgi:nucleotide-binding universal stress UspA family protein